MKYLNFFGVRVSASTQKTLLNYVQDKITYKGASYITFTNVHVIITALKNGLLKQALYEADLVAPDGMPLVWAGKTVGKNLIERCSGPDIMKRLIEISEEKGYTHYFYGSTDETILELKKQLREKYPNLKIVGTYSPPFRELTAIEDLEITEEINNLSPDIIWIGLGAPKQEIWMNEHKNKINRGVMLGVGAAFDFIANTKKRAPLWMQKIGLEWLFRLLSEPGRLWKRYLVTNFLFVINILTKGVQMEEKD